MNVFAYAVQALMLFFVYWIIRIIEIERKRAEQSMRLKAMVANYQSMNENAQVGLKSALSLCNGGKLPEHE